MRRGAAVIVLAAALGVLAPLLVGAAAPVNEETVHAIAANLRCVVCQSLSVADSPSETARQMRDIIRERLAAGETPEQVTAYFVTRYGDWILLAPPRRGFTLLVWVVPFVGLALGLVVVGVALRRWSRAAAARGDAPLPEVDAATRERIRREMAEGGP
jgi:cytochrome c-type biogenesis protein CcmH